MANRYMKDLVKLDVNGLKRMLTEAQQDKVSLDAKVHAGTDPKAAQLSRGVRKRIARLKTLLRQMESTQG